MAETRIGKIVEINKEEMVAVIEDAENGEKRDAAEPNLPTSNITEGDTVEYKLVTTLLNGYQIGTDLKKV